MTRHLLIALATCCLSIGCRHTAPQLYPDAPPHIEPPALTVYQPTPGDCAEAMPIYPGDTSACGGVLVPTHQSLELLQLADVAFPWVTERLTIERQGRLDDRAHAQATYGELWDHDRATMREATGLRIAVPMVAVLCIVVGAAVGVAAAEVAP